MLKKSNDSDDVSYLFKDFNALIDALKYQPNDVLWNLELERFNEKINQFYRTNINPDLAVKVSKMLTEIALKRRAIEQEERQAEKKQEAKNRALLAWVEAGGDPNLFMIALTSIE